VALAAVFLLKTFFPAWNSLNTDFPNYYTAARAYAEGARLEQLYDWPSFQRFLRESGVTGQQGAYAPQPPPALLVFLPLARLTPLAAKRVWLLLNLAFILTTYLLLRRSTGLRAWQYVALWVASYGALHTNFLYGQYYALLLFLLAVAWYAVNGRKPGAAGAALGLAAGLKLWGAPFLLYFARLRQWRAVAAMSLAVAAMAVVSLALFGLSGNLYFVQVILPRAFDGLLTDPYHPAFDSLTVLLRRTFVAEPTLNPDPLLAAPAVFFFLRRFYLFGVLALTLLALPGDDARRSFSWFTITLLFLAPITSSYHMLLLILPVALLLDGCSRRGTVLLLGSLLLATAPMEWLPPFRRTAALAVIWLWAGLPFLRRLPRRELAFVTAGVLVVAVVAGIRHTEEFRREPAQLYQAVPLPAGTLYAAAPLITAAGLSYQGVDAVSPPPRSAESPDGRYLAYAERHNRSTQLFLKKRATGEVRELTPDHCNSSSPAWSPDAKTLYFASDCNRGYGLPALFRLQVE